MQRGNQPPVIDGPIFEKGGLYNIRVDIEGASSPKTLVSEPLSFETFVSVAQEQNFLIQTANVQEVPVIVKTYYDDVEDFEYDDTNDSISFDMPFNWNPNYVDLVKVVHEEIRLPKTFDPYSEDTQFKGYVNGIELTGRAVLSDPYSSAKQNIVHFLVTGNELKRVNDQLSSDHYDENMISFKLFPEDGIQRKSTNIELDSGVLTTIEWDDNFEGPEMALDFTFFDSSGNLLKDARYGFTLSDDKGNDIITNMGNDQSNSSILASEGLDTQNIMVSKNGKYTIKIALFGTGIGSNTDVSYAGLGTGLMEITSQTNLDDVLNSDGAISIPNWIIINAGWWANDQIGDSDFVQGIQFLIKEGIMKIPTIDTGTNLGSNEIPMWIKNNAGWWAEGIITDSDFVSGIQYLISNGILEI
ncbi:MAG: peptidase [Nitrosopumilaceae archaeon]